MTPTTNHELLQEYINNVQYKPTVQMLQEIQSRLIEPMEYEIGKKYEFSDDGKEWKQLFLHGYGVETAINIYFFTHIRPVQVPPEVTSAIAFLEKQGYIISKQ